MEDEVSDEIIDQLLDGLRREIKKREINGVMTNFTPQRAGFLSGWATREYVESVRAGDVDHDAFARQCASSAALNILSATRQNKGSIWN